MTYVSPHIERLPNITSALRNGETVSPVTVREFLHWFFGSQRRGRWIVPFIRKKLGEQGLRTVPDFESAYLGAEIQFELDVPEVISEVRNEPVEAEAGSSVDRSEAQITSDKFDDPTYRISKLAAANKTPISVGPDATLAEAITLMMVNDFSQLPVMTNERSVKGAISWKTIGSKLALGKSPKWVRDVMNPHPEISSDASLFTAIRIIVEHDFALVRAADQKISGIITTSDLSLQFEQLSEPFLLLGEIENHIRKLLGSKLSQEEMAAVKDPGDEDRSVQAASDLTFGEYQRLIENPSNWSQFNLNLDRAVFVKQLDKIRLIRNDVMHFDPDGIEEEALEVLRDFARFLRDLQAIGAM